MRFFVETADVDQIRKANDMGVICGVTTNPSLIAKSGRQFEDVIKEITSIVDGAISGEVKDTTTDAEGMIKEGREIAKIHPNMVVKIPTTIEGLKATKVLSSEGIKTNLIRSEKCHPVFLRMEIHMLLQLLLLIKQMIWELSVELQQTLH